MPTFQRQGEYLMLRLRTADGVDFLDLEKRYNIDSTPYEEAFRSLLGSGLVAHQGTRWHLTEKGFLVSNSIINAIVEAGQQTATQNGYWKMEHVSVLQKRIGPV